MKTDDRVIMNENEPLFAHLLIDFHFWCNYHRKVLIKVKMCFLLILSEALKMSRPIRTTFCFIRNGLKIEQLKHKKKSGHRVISTF